MRYREITWYNLKYQQITRNNKTNNIIQQRITTNNNTLGYLILFH